MSGVYSTFYNILLNTYGVVDGQPYQVSDALYWLAWCITTFVFLLIFFLFLFGVWLILRSFTRRKKRNEIHYYYHK